MNEESNGSEQAVDFIELISQDLPWGDIDRALGDKPHQLAAAVVTDRESCSPAEQEFNPDDLSLFNAFADSLPSLGPQPAGDTDIKASSAADVERDGDIRLDPLQDIETDLNEVEFDSPGEIILSSQMEYIMADILDSSDGQHGLEKQAIDDEKKQDYVEPGDSSADKDVRTEQADEEHRRTNEVADVAETGCAATELMRGGETVSDNSSVIERSQMQDKTGSQSQRDASEGLAVEQSSGSDTGRQNSSSNDNDNGDVEDEKDHMTASQQWVFEQLNTHIVQQQDEASRINSLRLPPPPGTQPRRRDPVSRAIHAFSTELEATKLDEQLTERLLVDKPNVSECCKLLSEYDQYQLSPMVLVQYPFFAGTVDACCRWVGPLADELHTAARRLRAFMMAMYARHSVDEGFLTALDRQVTVLLFSN